jgi:Sulfotransferase domain
MALKIIGAGFGRTGTWSMQYALNQLGFPCYHMSEVVLNKANKSHLNFWRKVANSPPGAQQDWEQVFAKYSAAVDNPACCVWRELRVAYPDAKVLLTLHPLGAETWYESTIATIYFTEGMWQFKVLEWLSPWARKFGGMSHKLVFERSLQGAFPDKAKAIARYNAHIDEVKAAVPADKLLIFSVDQGWAPLCAFLGVPQPAGNFPDVNHRAEFKKTVGDVIKGMYVTVAAYAAGALALLYGAYRFLL